MECAPASPAVEMWLVALRAEGRKPKTIGIYKESIECFGRFLGTDPEGASKFDLRRWMVDLQERYSPATASLRLRSVKTFFAFLVAEELRPDHPGRGLKVTVPEKLPERPTAADIAAVLKSCPKTLSGTRDAALIAFLAGTGARKGEVAALRVGDVDIAGQRVQLHDSKSKAREVPITADIALALGRWLRYHGGRRESFWDCGDPYGLVRHALRRRTRERWTPHTLRRFFAEQWLAKGGSESGLMELCGWKSSEMIRLYTRGARGQLAHDEYDRLMA